MHRIFRVLAVAIVAVGAAEEIQAQTLPPYEIIPALRMQTKPPRSIYRFGALKIDRQNKKIYYCLVTTTNQLADISGDCELSGSVDALASSYAALLPSGPPAYIAGYYDFWLISNTTGAVVFCVATSNSLRCIDIPSQVGSAHPTIHSALPWLFRDRRRLPSNE
jgi:hypothetical protein